MPSLLLQPSMEAEQWLEAAAAEAPPGATQLRAAAPDNTGVQPQSGYATSADGGPEKPQLGNSESHQACPEGSSTLEQASLPLHLASSDQPRGPPLASDAACPATYLQTDSDERGSQGAALARHHERPHRISELPPPQSIQRGDISDASASTERDLLPASPMSISPDDIDASAGDPLPQSSARPPLPSQGGVHHSASSSFSTQQRFWSASSSPSSATARTRRSSATVGSPSLVPAFPSRAARGSPQNQSPSSQSSPRSLAPSPSAATMFQVASQAGLQSVSSALVSQAAHTIGEATANGRYQYPTSVPTAARPSETSLGQLRTDSSSPSEAVTAPSDTCPERRFSSQGGSVQALDAPEQRSSPENQSDYSVIMNAHLTSALEGAKQMTSSSPVAPTGQALAMDPALAAQVRMASIATKTATEEAERQLRIHALLRASGGYARQVNEATNDSDATSLPGTPEGSAQGSSPDRGSSATRARLQALGLGHIPLPSKGFEQAWGRKDDSGAPQNDEGSQGGLSGSNKPPARYYDAADALAGVPSMPCEYSSPGPRVSFELRARECFADCCVWPFFHLSSDTHTRHLPRVRSVIHVLVVR